MRDFFAILALIISVGTLIWNYVANIRQKLYDEKLRVYLNYLEIVASTTLSQEKQIEEQVVQKHILAKQKMIFFAPKSILDLASEIEPLNFKKEKNMSNRDVDMKYVKYLKLLEMMRKDLKLIHKREDISLETLCGLLGGSENIEVLKKLYNEN